jgi:hypothetical protein
MNGIKEYGFETGFDSFSLGELHGIRNRTLRIQENLHQYSLKNMTPGHYLSSVESFLPEELISPQNYAEIQRLASHFTGGITSFFGFESRLNSTDARADYLFAVSSRKGEREALAEMLQNGQLPTTMMSQVEWQHLREFAMEWANPTSILYNNVLGLWFEFDMIEPSSETPVPCIFVHTPLLRIDAPEDVKEFTWLTTTALPLLTGHRVSEKIEQQMIRAVQHLPSGSGLMDVGVMLSRAVTGVRFCIVRICPNQIIPYLTSLGWSDSNEEVATLLKELEGQVSRVVLHITITEEGVDQKIGIECSFSPDLYHLETRWSAFLDYLIKKGVCLPEKKEALLSFSGVEQEDQTNDFTLISYEVSAKIPDDNFSRALVRYISHIKLIYTPNAPIQAKAYPGVRLFGRPHTSAEGMY